MSSGNSSNHSDSSSGSSEDLADKNKVQKSSSAVSICRLSCLKRCLCTAANSSPSPRPSSEPKPFLRTSLFSHVPPTICFYTKSTKVSKPQKHITQKLLWCHNTLLPIVMRHALATSHFTVVEESKKWIGYWGRHLKTLQYHTILPHQRINHFPGAFHMGRKDRLWIHLQEAHQRFPEDDQFLVMPYTYILPKDQKRLKAFLEGPETRHVILKPGVCAVTHSSCRSRDRNQHRLQVQTSATQRTANSATLH
ncbi:hypothetical protein L596_023541 [Steinernema carpocapsae]|uniref:Uncharacterized protein n=1 Tax=Steinernema carpocapsae TaxID=34508 RepID=A0A4U5MDY6_STECR|nr:hypothetical protein L596_023541 [Steinernema carpocapsae]